MEDTMDKLTKDSVVPTTYNEDILQNMTIIKIRELAAGLNISTNGSKAVLIERYLEDIKGDNKKAEENLLMEALMKWSASAQREYLKMRNKPTSGTKEALVHRIIGCVTIEKAVEIIKGQREFLKIKKKHKSSDMEVDEDMEDSTIKNRAAAMLVKKRITEKKRKSDTAGVSKEDEEESSATKKGAHAAPKVPPPQDCIWKYRR